MEEKFVDNNGVLIHYIITNKTSEYPVVFIPGAISGADDLYKGIKEYLNYYGILISIRGRGKSSAPVEGYTKEKQVSDIEAVIEKEQIKKFYIFGHSFGAGLASYYSIKHPEKILGLIIADFPPIYPKYSEKWAERIINDFEGVNENFVNGMVKDGCREDFYNGLTELKFKKMVIKAGEKSLLEDEDINIIINKIPNMRLETINSGHEMFYENPAEVTRIVNEFIKK